MHRFHFALCIVGATIAMSSEAAESKCPALLDHTVRQLAGEQVDRLC